MSDKGNVRFVRIHGRIVPIRSKGPAKPKKEKNGLSNKHVTGGVVAGAAAGIGGSAIYAESSVKKFNAGVRLRDDAFKMRLNKFRRIAERDRSLPATIEARIRNTVSKAAAFQETRGRKLATDYVAKAQSHFVSKGHADWLTKRSDTVLKLGDRIQREAIELSNKNLSASRLLRKKVRSRTTAIFYGSVIAGGLLGAAISRINKGGNK